MRKVVMILRKPPYGDINAAEAVRHALGAVTQDIKVSLILVDGGVQLARKGQDDTDTGFTNLESALKDCKGIGVEVIADDVSLIGYGLNKEDLVEGVETASEAAIAALIKQAGSTMIF